MGTSVLQKERAAVFCRSRTRHGLTNTPEHRAWTAMKSRCSDAKVPSHENYGARGISVCRRWIDSFEDFYADMGPRPSSKHTLERRDNSKGYGPENCVWASMIEQQNNKRNTFYVVYDGERVGLGIALRRSGSELQHGTVARRLREGWDLHLALFTPVIHQRDRKRPRRSSNNGRFLKGI